MNSRQIRERLARVEAKLPDHAEADDLAERQERFRLTVDDPIALGLYHEVLTSLSGTCAHRSIGLCATCWTTRQGSKEVQEALNAYQSRIHALQHHPEPPHTKGDPS